MIKVAVIGAGNMGFYHARTYSSLKGVKLVAVSDINEQSGLKVADQFNAKYYPDYIQLLKNETLDAVSITTPTEYHKEIALKFIEQGIPILVEKPLALNSNDAQEIIDQADKKKVLLLTGHIERYNPAIIKLIELIDINTLGKIISINVKRVGIEPPKFNKSGVVLDLAVHDLDILMQIFKKTPNFVFATGGSSKNNGVQDHAEIFLNFNGIGCFIQCNWTTPIKIRSFSITGTKGYAEVNLITQELECYKSLDTNEGPKSYKEFVKKFANPKKINITLNKEEPLKLEIKNFLNTIKGSQVLTVSPIDAVSTIKLAEAVNKSMLINANIKL